jgi:hypothetical protein
MVNWSGVIQDVEKMGDFACNLLIMRDLPPPYKELAIRLLMGLICLL